MKKNLLFIFSDQHRSMDIGCYGNEQVKTTNLDKLSLSGMKFSNCISNTPVCVPSRGNLLTGLMPMKHRAATNDLPIDTNVRSVANVLGEAGYHTGYIGKWHLAGVPREKSIPEKGRLGFKEWKVNNCCHDYMNSYYYDENNVYHKIEEYEPVKQTDLAIDFMERNCNRPWGLYLSLGPPHDPYDQVPQKYKDIYKDVKINLRDNVPYLKGSTIDQDSIIKIYKDYYAQITAIDDQIGRLIATLELTKQLDNTIIVYTSDHGDMLGSHSLMNKQVAYNESVNVPLIVFSENQVAYGNNDELIGLVDLPVSLMGLMNLEFSNETDGRDLSNLFTCENAKGLDACYMAEYFAAHQLQWSGGVEWRAIKTSRHTYIKTVDGSVELYDNQEDAFQMDNLVRKPEYKCLKDQLNDKLEYYIAKHDKMLPREELAEYYGLKDAWDISEKYFDKVFASGRVR